MKPYNPAHPTPHLCDNKGMSIREYLIGQAMIGMAESFLNCRTCPGGTCTEEGIAQAAIDFADKICEKLKDY